MKQRENLLWAIVDFDGTLAESTWTVDNPHAAPGQPILDNLDKLDELSDAGYKIIIHTSRGSADYELIESWLNEFQVPFKQILTGKPLGAIYIDDRGRHSDAESWLP
jgi:predicted mannosyl-3-phosphoglycerate phosphatase (HAD superfamily)